MFLKSSPASALSDDIVKTGSVSQNRLSSLWLFGFYTSAVNAHALTRCARDNNLARGALSTIGAVQLQ